MRPTFTTSRLDVYEVVCERTNWCKRLVYLAMYKEEDVHHLVCTLVLDYTSEREYWIEWLEVREDERRKGIATELLHAVEDHLDGANLDMCGGSPEGEAFVNSYCEPVDERDATYAADHEETWRHHN